MKFKQNSILKNEKTKKNDKDFANLGLEVLEGPKGLKSLESLEGLESLAGANIADVAGVENVQSNVTDSDTQITLLSDNMLEAKRTQHTIEGGERKQEIVEKRRRKNNFDLNNTMNVVSASLHQSSPPLYHSEQSLLEMLLAIYKEDFPNALNETAVSYLMDSLSTEAV